jgi:hypothetical protein
MRVSVYRSRAKFLRAKRMVGSDSVSINEILGITTPSGASSPAPLSAQSTAAPTPRAASPSSSVAETKAAAKAAKASAAEAAARANIAATEAGERPKSMVAVTEALPPSADPSFASGGGMIVSPLSVQEYLSRRLTVKKAAILRAQREKQKQDDDAVWARAATVGTAA